MACFLHLHISKLFEKKWWMVALCLCSKGCTPSLTFGSASVIVLQFNASLGFEAFFANNLALVEFFDLEKAFDTTW